MDIWLIDHDGPTITPRCYSSGNTENKGKHLFSSFISYVERIISNIAIKLNYTVMTKSFETGANFGFQSEHVS